MPCVTALLLLRSLFTTRAFTTHITNEIYPETDTTGGINLFGIGSINLPEAIGTNKLPNRCDLTHKIAATESLWFRNLPVLWQNRGHAHPY